MRSINKKPAGESIRVITVRRKPTDLHHAIVTAQGDDRGQDAAAITAPARHSRPQTGGGGGGTHGSGAAAAPSGLSSGPQRERWAGPAAPPARPDLTEVIERRRQGDIERGGIDCNDINKDKRSGNVMKCKGTNRKFTSRHIDNAGT